jgi:hypothetical protein
MDMQLALDNALAPFFENNFGFGITKAANLAAIFGMMNFFARPLGGLISDLMARHFGMRGRLWWLFTLLACGGVSHRSTASCSCSVACSSLAAQHHPLRCWSSTIVYGSLGLRPKAEMKCASFSKATEGVILLCIGLRKVLRLWGSGEPGRGLVSEVHFMLALPCALLRLTGACCARPSSKIIVIWTCHNKCLLSCTGVSVSLVGVVHRSFPATMVMVILAGIFLEVNLRLQDTKLASPNNYCLLT